MRAVVTGVAGFIGSTLAKALLDRGANVVGIDSLTAYYDTEMKRSNISALHHRKGFEYVEDDLLALSLDDLLGPDITLFHLAGQPGVRASWGAGFSEYVNWNVSVTQRLLETCRQRGVRRFVNSSSSSVYGRAERFPTSEEDLPLPFSPYGVTKLAAEHLSTLYGANFRVPTVSLRYFTVYGPGQRPDMATHRLIESALHRTPFVLNGDGSQIRDFTFISDVVGANLLAAEADVEPGSVFNIGGGSSTSLRRVIELVESATGMQIPLESAPRAAGDPDRTGANIEKARQILGWEPEVDIELGVRQQVAWHRGRAEIPMT